MFVCVTPAQSLFALHAPKAGVGIAILPTNSIATNGKQRNPLTVVVCFHDELPLPNCADACAYCCVCPLAILILVCFAAAGFIPVQGALLR